MAKVMKTEGEGGFERIYTVPLRAEWSRAPRVERSKRALGALRSFLSRHMKAEPDDVRISGGINKLIWKHGAKKPPARVKVKATRDKEGMVYATLPEEDFDFAKDLAAKKEKKSKLEKAKEVFVKEKTGEIKEKVAEKMKEREALHGAEKSGKETEKSEMPETESAKEKGKKEHKEKIKKEKDSQ